MGKRSDFDRAPRDFYPTPLKAVLPLLPHLPRKIFSFGEPCAGDGRLVHHIEAESFGVCRLAMDLDPQAPWIEQRNALFLENPEVDLIITNPPWYRPTFHALIEHLSGLAPTWLLHDADWLFTKQATPFLPWLRKTVVIGRVSWMENGVSGKDNCVWSLFDQESDQAFEFHGRAA